MKESLTQLPSKLLLVWAAVLVGALIFASSWLRITHISCSTTQNQTTPCPSWVVDQLQLHFHNRPLLWTEVSTPTATAYEIVDWSKALPDTLVLTLKLHELGYAIQSQGTWLPVSRSGIILPESSGPPLGCLVTVPPSQALTLFEPVPQSQHDLLLGICDVQTQHWSMHTLRIEWRSDEEIVVTRDLFPQMVIDLQDSALGIEHLRALATLPSNLSVLQASESSTLDLRFVTPVLKPAAAQATSSASAEPQDQ